jgi:hypothetical protein
VAVRLLQRPPLRVGDPAGGDLTGTYPNPTIAASAVNSLKVADRSLGSDDIALFEGVITADLGPIPPGSCPGVGQRRAGLQTSDYVVILPTDPLPFHFPSDLVVQGRIQASDGSGDVVAYVCNFTPFEADPPQTTFRYIVIR